MSRLEHDILAEYALGTLPEAERARVRSMIDRDPQLAAEVESLMQALGALPDSLPPVRPSAGGRDRLLRAAQPRPRLERFVQRLAAFFDLSLDRAREVLKSVDDPGVYEESGLPGVRFFHLQGGPTMAGAHIGIVRIPAGGRFPFHSHGGGTEKVLFLQGACFEPETGRTLKAGDQDEVVDGAFAHELIVLPGPDLLYAAALFGELTFPHKHA